MALLNKLLGKDEREENLKKEIKSLEFRKESVLASINGEIKQLKSEQKTLFLEAGKYAYETWCENKTSADLTTYWNQVQELDGKIEAQKAKMNEMTARYDEEIKLIASNLNAPINSGVPAVSADPDAPTCPNCGAPIAEDDIFCQGCGTKLQ